MKEKLIEILKLDAKASETEIITAVAALATGAQALSKTEEAIAKKIAQSGGALNREQAILSLQQQDEANKQKKGKK